VSHHVSSWAYRQKIGDAGTKLILVKLADQANDEGVSFPSQQTLLEECEAGHGDTIKKRIRKLKQLGLLIVVPWYTTTGRQTSSMYVLPHKGIPDAVELARILATADRQGYAGEVIDLTGRGDPSHPSRTGVGGTSSHPPRGDSGHPSGVEPSHPSIEEPSLELSEEPFLPGVPGEDVSDEVFDVRFAIEFALSAALSVDTVDMTSRERAQWRIVVADLVNVGATGAEITERCDAYRRIWPDAKLTPMALDRHWSMLGAEVHVKTAGFDAWLDQAPGLFDRVTAHEIVDDTAGIEAPERTRRHSLVDERFDERDTQREAA
jgi:hypothetical protein